MSLVAFDQFNTPLLNKTNHLFCVLAVRLQTTVFWGPENAKLLKTGFKVQDFENDTVIACVNFKKANL